MNISVLFVGPAAQLVLLGDENFAFKESAAAPAALARAAAGGSLYTGSLKGNEYRLVGISADRPLLRALSYGAGKDAVAGRFGITAAFPDLLCDIDELAAEVFFRQTELFDLGFEETVHNLGTAEEDGVLFTRRGVLFDDVGGNEAVFKAVLLLVGKNMDRLELQPYVKIISYLFIQRN